MAKARREEREFQGAQPRNKAISDRIRKDGYLGMMFNKEDFLDAVIWAANIVYDYRDFFAKFKDRVVIPMTELPFWKEDLVNAHFLLIIYYKMKQNLVFSEEFKVSLMTVAKFQIVADADIKVMERWDAHFEKTKLEERFGDIASGDIGDLIGTEKIFKHYSDMVTKEAEKYQNEIAKQ